ncbi:MAG: tetratricopeptide repeat protein, partial [Planctomycetaceae bacterium]|nr:tetratricopeptide repeat protein [Planctomycetaceae bacterium]
MNYEDLIKQAEIHFIAHEYPQAIEYATHAIEADPAGVDGYYWRASAFRRIWENDKAQADADALLACTPHSALHLAYRGYAYILKKEYEQAVTECTEALRQDDSVKEAYHYRGWAYNNLKKFDDSIADYNKAIECDPKYAAAYYNRGNTYNKKGDYDRAIDDYNKALAIDPNDATA